MIEVDKEVYLNFLKGRDLVVISSFSDIDGTLNFGYGVPAMDTDWGLEGSEETVARCYMRKNNPHEKWTYMYFIKDTYL